jgi:hypothetical protein
MIKGQKKFQMPNLKSKGQKFQILLFFHGFELFCSQYSGKVIGAEKSPAGKNCNNQRCRRLITMKNLFHVCF